MKEQHVKQESRSKFDFHPDVVDVDADADAKDDILDSEEEMQETQNVPSAQQRPSLPPMDSEKSIKNIKQSKDFVPRANQFSELETQLNIQ